MAGAGWWLYTGLARHFEDELGQQLTGMARAAAELTDPAWVTVFKSGDEATGLYRGMQKRLQLLVDAHQARNIYIFDREQKTLIDAGGEKRIGETYHQLKRDQTELAEVWQGRTAHSVLFRGNDGVWYKAGYAPLYNAQREVVAAVGVDASARFVAVLNVYKKIILGAMAACLVIGCGAGLYLWMVVLAPVRALVNAVERMSTGNLQVRLEGISHNEVGYLGASFNRMAQTLAENREELRRLYHEASQRAERIQSFNDYIVESMTDGIITCDLEGRVTSLNQAAEQVLGLTSTAAIDRDYGPLLAGWPELRTAIDRILQTGQTLTHADIRTSGPQGLHLQVTTAFLNDPRGEQLGISVLFADISEFKRMEARVKLKERLAALGEMSAAIAHELRNPLNGINLLLGLLKRSDDRAKQLELVQRTEAAVAALNAIITDFLVYARPAEPQRALVQLPELLDSALAMALPAENDPAMVIKRAYDAGITAINADRGQLQQVLLNLFINGREAMSRNGTLRVSTTRSGAGRCTITVEDDGPGIAADILPKVFDPFFTTKDTGTGLGLSIARKIVEAHHGTLEAQSPVHDGRGARFIIELPIAGA
jgi:two-component system sensor histidine kinase AtoS